MKNISFLISVIIILGTLETQAQYLIDVVQLNNISIESDNGKSTTAPAIDKMLIPFNSDEIMVYKNESFSVWVNYKMKRCGKKVNFKGTPYILTKDGEKYSGKQFSEKKKKEDAEGPNFIVGNYKDDIKVGDNDENQVTTSFSYSLRYTN